MTFKKGDKVKVTSGFSSFFGQEGTVVENVWDDVWSVKIDNYDPILFYDSALELVKQLTPFEAEVRKYINKELNHA